MELHRAVGASIMAASLISILFLIPLPGTSSTQSFNISGKQVNFILVNDSEIQVKNQEWNAWGEYDLVKEKVTLATEWLPLAQFMSTCSHEVYHVKTPETGGAEDHEEMKATNYVLYGFVPPWNWQSECFHLIDNRLYVS